MPAYWRHKITKNRARDGRNTRKLRRLGWRVIRIWEHQAGSDIDGVVKRVAAAVRRGPISRGTT